MLTLYYAPGACSMAAHIVLEESGEKYEPRKVDLASGELVTGFATDVTVEGDRIVQVFDGSLFQGNRSYRCTVTFSPDDATRASSSPSR